MDRRIIRIFDRITSERVAYLRILFGVVRDTTDPYRIRCHDLLWGRRRFSGLSRRQISALSVGRLFEEDSRCTSIIDADVAEISRRCANRQNRFSRIVAICRLALAWPVGRFSEYLPEADRRYPEVCRRQRRHCQGPQISEIKRTEVRAAGFYYRGVCCHSPCGGTNDRNHWRYSFMSLVAVISLRRLGIGPSCRIHAVHQNGRCVARSRRIVLSGRKSKGQRGRLVSSLANNNLPHRGNLRSRTYTHLLATKYEKIHASRSISKNDRQGRSLCAQRGRNGISSHPSIDGKLYCRKIWNRGSAKKTWPFEPCHNAEVSRSANLPASEKRGCHPSAELLNPAPESDSRQLVTTLLVGASRHLQPRHSGSFFISICGGGVDIDTQYQMRPDRSFHPPAGDCRYKNAGWSMWDRQVRPPMQGGSFWKLGHESVQFRPAALLNPERPGQRGCGPEASPKHASSTDDACSFSSVGLALFSLN